MRANRWDRMSRMRSANSFITDRLIHNETARAVRLEDSTSRRRGLLREQKRGVKVSVDSAKRVPMYGYRNSCVGRARWAPSR